LLWLNSRKISPEVFGRIEIIARIAKHDEAFNRFAPNRFAFLNKEYETVGFVPNVVFPCATLSAADTGRIAIYTRYGLECESLRGAFYRSNLLILKGLLR
jgi:hypothetical protein